MGGLCGSGQLLAGLGGAGRRLGRCRLQGAQRHQLRLQEARHLTRGEVSDHVCIDIVDVSLSSFILNVVISYSGITPLNNALYTYTLHSTVPLDTDL